MSWENHRILKVPKFVLTNLRQPLKINWFYKINMGGIHPP